MDLGDLSKMFDKAGMDKVGDVVEFVVDHRDELDKLIAIVKEAPALLGAFADALGDAGDHAKDAAVSLAGKAGKGGAAGTLVNGAGALVKVGDQLAEAAEFIDDVAGFMATIDIPNVDVHYAKVAGVNIVSGVDIGKDKLLEDPSQRLASTATTLTKAKGDLAGLAENLEQLAAILTAVGGAIDKLGDGLKTSGTQASKMFA